MLELKHISKTFYPGTVNAKTALFDLNLTLNDGDFVTVIGGNGAGKSTMLNAIAGAFSVDSGSIIIDGKNVTKLPEYKRAAFIGRVFQDPMMGTAPTMGIEENLALAARRGKRRTLYLNHDGTGEYVWKKDELIDLTFPQVLDKMVECFPDQYCFKYTTLDYTRTYEEFRDDVDTFARALVSMGVKAGS